MADKLPAGDLGEAWRCAEPVGVRGERAAGRAGVGIWALPSERLLFRPQLCPLIAWSGT